MNERFRRWAVLLGIVATGLLLTGCGSTEDSPDPVKATFSSLWTHALADCSVGCHKLDAVSDGTENGPDLSTKDKFISNLTNKTSVDYPNWLRTGTCTTVAMIAPTDANNSTVAASLIESVSSTLSQANGDCITSYNFHADLRAAITDQAVANALVQWINDGAANN